MRRCSASMAAPIRAFHPSRSSGCAQGCSPSARTSSRRSTCTRACRTRSTPTTGRRIARKRPRTAGSACSPGSRRTASRDPGVRRSPRRGGGGQLQRSHGGIRPRRAASARLPADAPDLAAPRADPRAALRRRRSRYERLWRQRRPAPAPDSSNYAKRTLAAELVALMGALGHERFSVVGHDRGARIAYRMAFDHPARVAKLVVLDIVPTGAMWAGAGQRFAIGTFHWGFLAQGGGMPERLIGGDPDCWLEFCCRKWARDFTKLADAMPEYARAFRKPEVIAATCADYRAGATLDDEHDRADLAAGRKIGCPTRAIWSETFVGRGKTADPLGVWREYARDVHGFPVRCGHFIPEEAPEAVANPIAEFLAG